MRTVYLQQTSCYNCDELAGATILLILFVFSCIVTVMSSYEMDAAGSLEGVENDTVSDTEDPVETLSTEFEKSGIDSTPEGLPVMHESSTDTPPPPLTRNTPFRSKRPLASHKLLPTPDTPRWNLCQHHREVVKRVDAIGNRVDALAAEVKSMRDDVIEMKRMLCDHIVGVGSQITTTSAPRSTTMVARGRPGEISVANP